MKKDFISPRDQSIPRGAYTPAIRVELGTATLLFVTGQLALDGQGQVVAPGDATVQSEYIFGLLGPILAEAGMSFGDVVRAQTYLTEMGDFAKFSAIRNRYLGESRPASTLLEVKGLAQPGCCVEIELTAIKANATS